MLRLKFVLFVSLLLTSVAHAGVKTVSMVTEGTGLTLHEAINNALVEAIGRVNGKSIESEKVTASMQVSVSDGNDEAYLFSEGYLGLVKEATKGAVSGYELVSKEQVGAHRWVVSIRSEVAKYERLQAASRKRIAIMPIRVAAGDTLKAC